MSESTQQQVQLLKSEIAKFKEEDEEVPYCPASRCSDRAALCPAALPGRVAAWRDLVTDAVCGRRVVHRRRLGSRSCRPRCASRYTTRTTTSARLPLPELRAPSATRASPPAYAAMRRALALTAVWVGAPPGTRLSRTTTCGGCP